MCRLVGAGTPHILGVERKARTYLLGNASSGYTTTCCPAYIPAKNCINIRRLFENRKKNVVSFFFIVTNGRGDGLVGEEF